MTEYEIRIQNSIVDILVNTFKFILRYEKHIEQNKIIEMVHEVEELETFEQKIKYLNTFKFMRAPIKTQMKRSNLYFGGEQ